MFCKILLDNLQIIIIIMPVGENAEVFLLLLLIIFISMSYEERNDWITKQLI